MKKLTIYSEIAYLFGILLLALGNSFSAYADFGMSMVVAPAYVLHLALVDILPWFSFGVAEYTVQALVILAFSPIGSAVPAFTEELKSDVGLSSAVNSISMVLSIAIIVALLLIML